MVVNELNMALNREGPRSQLMTRLEDQGHLRVRELAGEVEGKLNMQQNFFLVQ